MARLQVLMVGAARPTPGSAAPPGPRAGTPLLGAEFDGRLAAAGLAPTGVRVVDLKLTPWTRDCLHRARLWHLGQLLLLTSVEFRARTSRLPEGLIDLRLQRAIHEVRAAARAALREAPAPARVPLPPPAPDRHLWLIAGD